MPQNFKTAITGILIASLSSVSSAACPNPDDLKHLCAKIGSKAEDADPRSPYLYEYQRIIHEAACANPHVESEEEVRAKIQALWNTKDNYLLCENTQFDVAKGNVVKYAAHNLFTDFIVDVAEVWRVDLNWIDKADDRTSLDYIKDEARVRRGTSVGEKQSMYYDTLRKAGGKHRSEILRDAP